MERKNHKIYVFIKSTRSISWPSSKKICTFWSPLKCFLIFSENVYDVLSSSWLWPTDSTDIGDSKCWCQHWVSKYPPSRESVAGNAGASSSSSSARGAGDVTGGGGPSSSPLAGRGGGGPSSSESLPVGFGAGDDIGGASSSLPSPNNYCTNMWTPNTQHPSYHTTPRIHTSHRHIPHHKNSWFEITIFHTLLKFLHEIRCCYYCTCTHDEIMTQKLGILWFQQTTWEYLFGSGVVRSVCTAKRCGSNSYTWVSTWF